MRCAELIVAQSLSHDELRDDQEIIVLQECSSNEEVVLAAGVTICKNHLSLVPNFLSALLKNSHASSRKNKDNMRDNNHVSL